MNERIKELLDQSISGTSPQWLSRDDAKKLVKLIVQECIATVEGMEPGYKDYRDQIEDAFRRDCVAEIKHKFGVEE